MGTVPHPLGRPDVVRLIGLNPAAPLAVPVERAAFFDL